MLAACQDKLYADDKWAVLLIFQAMDAAAKDSKIKHVMSGVNPQGCQVFSFKAPSAEELNHDYLWRCRTRLPNRGHIGIFNRSYYEETLEVRLHPELLAKQKLLPQLVGKHIWKERFADIRHFERYLPRNGIVVRKFFLHVSKKEQKGRFLERIEDPNKNWKFSAGDVDRGGFLPDLSACGHAQAGGTDQAGVRSGPIFCPKCGTRMRIVACTCLPRRGAGRRQALGSCAAVHARRGGGPRPELRPNGGSAGAVRAASPPLESELRPRWPARPPFAAAVALQPVLLEATTVFRAW